MKDFFKFNYKIVIALGILLVIGGAQSSIGPLAGWIIIFGTLAYNSAKNMRLGTTKSSIYKHILAAGDLVVLFILVLYQGVEQNIEHPLPFIVWVGYLIAYMSIFLKRN